MDELWKFLTHKKKGSKCPSKIWNFPLTPHKNRKDQRMPIVITPQKTSSRGGGGIINGMALSKVYSMSGHVISASLRQITSTDLNNSWYHAKADSNNCLLLLVHRTHVAVWLMLKTLYSGYDIYVVNGWIPKILLRYELILIRMPYFLLELKFAFLLLSILNMAIPAQTLLLITNEILNLKLTL